MKKHLMLATIATIALTGAAHAQDSDKTKDFVVKAAISNQFELETSKLAIEKASSPDVKAFAEKIITDHTKAGADLRAAIGTAGITTPAPDALDEDHRDKVTKLSEKTGSDFDEAYIDEQEKAHDDAIDLFKDYAKDGDNAALKNFAATTLPTLEAHDKHLEEVDDKAEAHKDAQKDAKKASEKAEEKRLDAATQ